MNRSQSNYSMRQKAELGVSVQVGDEEFVVSHLFIPRLRALVSRADRAYKKAQALVERDDQILQLLATGMSQAKVADALGIAPELVSITRRLYSVSNEGK